jgi:hypothetical protein
MALQAWGTYGVLWPVVHDELGISPDLGRGSVRVVPQVPAGQDSVGGRHVRLGEGSLDVRATSSSHRVVTRVRQTKPWRLTLGAVLSSSARVRSVRLDGRPTPYDVVRTARGREVLVHAGHRVGGSRLVVRLG